ncbi:hypothetical protein B296_00028120 [Ensete ventricosum]|uniref:Uncharacterized protein n=1 Tax=Ensete ventricosum TaxID=4639 RepID=A0A426ZCJ7_ENSVE|nr:hypothetical protein B296_00028120 [Ensete ventricosum]
MKSTPHAEMEYNDTDYESFIPFPSITQMKSIPHAEMEYNITDSKSSVTHSRLDGRSLRVQLDRSVADVGTRVRRRCLSSGSVVVSCKKVGSGRFAIPPLRRGVRAFIVSVTGCSYLRSLLPLLLTMSSYFSIPSVVLVVRRMSCLLQLWRVDLTHVRANLGINLGDLVKKVNSTTNIRDLAEKANSGTNLGDLTERTDSGTNLGDLAERTDSSTNLGDLTERANSSTNLGDLTERASLGTNLEDLAEKVNSGTNLGDLAERADSGTNLGELIERANSGTNLGDSTEKANLGTNIGDLAESKLAKFVEISLFCMGEPETSSSGVSSGPPSLVDARVLRDLEVMEAGHDLDIAVIEGSLTANRERYSISVGYGLHFPWFGQRPYSSDVPGVCISMDALEADIQFPLHPNIEESPRYSSKRQSDTLVPSDDPSRRHKKVKILSRRHKSHHGEGGSRSHSKGKEPAEPVEEPEMLVKSVEEDASPVFHRPRFGSSGPRQGDASQMGEAEELDEVGAGAVYAPIGSTVGPSHQGDGAGNLSTLIFMSRSFSRFFLDDCFMDYRITSLQQEIDALKSGGGLEVVAVAEKHAFELEKEFKKTKRGQDEALQ